MEQNEIKKALYKQKPTARIVDVNKTGITYFAPVKVEDGTKIISFLIPLDDIGDGIFQNEMPAQLLIRYLYNHDS